MSSRHALWCLGVCWKRALYSREPAAAPVLHHVAMSHVYVSCGLWGSIHNCSGEGTFSILDRRGLFESRAALLQPRG